MAPERNAAADGRCEHCGLPFPKPPVVETVDGTELAFCSALCRDAYLEHHPERPVYHGIKRIETGVDGLDVQLPDGMPRNTFVLVQNSPGAQWEALLAEIVWRTLERGEPVVVVACQDLPITIVQHLLSLEWNVLPFIESEALQFIDCFTYRVSSSARMIDRFTDWNRYLFEATEGVTTPVTDPETMEPVHSAIDSLAEELGMRGTGVVMIDSLYELGTLTQPVHAHNFLKDVRADLSKGRYVPVFGGASTVVEATEFPLDMSYLADGVVEVNQLFGDEHANYERVACVAEMRGVRTRPRDVQFEYETGRGMVTVDEPADASQ